VERGQQLLGLGDVRVANPEMHPAVLDIHGVSTSSSARLCVRSPLFALQSHFHIPSHRRRAAIVLICNGLKIS
jgi:hypothetical protein